MELVQIPVEVAEEAVVFRVVPRGYDRKQVDRHVAGLEQALAELRWEHDDLERQRRELAEQRAEQDRWVPSFTALGRRAAEVLRLADEEAAALRAQAAADVAAREQEAVGGLDALIAERQEALRSAQETAERERKQLEAAVQERRDLLEAELVRRRRDADLEITGRLNQAAAQAQDLRAEAARQADELRATARAEVAHLQRRRDELASDLTDLSARLVAVVHRLDRTDTPLEVHTA